MKKPKIIFVDLDGTTIDLKIKGHKWISKTNIEYINKARDQGIEVVVSTGRPPTKVSNVFLEPMGCLDNFIAWNGTYVKQDGKVLFKGKFEKEDVDKIFEEIKKYKISVIFNSDTRDLSFTSSWIVSLALKWTRGKARRYNEFKNDSEINKMVLWHPSKRRLFQFANVLKEKYRGICEIAYTGSKDQVLEITPITCSKGESEVRYALARGVDPQDCVHIGDTLNDATCSGQVGKLIAMNNSCQTMKMIADVISPFTNKEAGLGRTIDLFYLNK
ncbi:HAD hydrolase family protein [Mycoplasma tauri]|uniref:HAD hydrolase family protein n=1 Tax=Mycoplasma tauri TaxID=547987 RepID=UPI001CBB5FC6|nr:HAD family hydrolase [Mycoplasma tauri]MBZ4204007.1 Cof-type HAD-IIB family hydrolase [Mycoplasma tauri]